MKPPGLLDKWTLCQLSNRAPEHQIRRSDLQSAMLYPSLQLHAGICAHLRRGGEFAAKSSLRNTREHPDVPAPQPRSAGLSKAGRGSPGSCGSLREGERATAKAGASDLRPRAAECLRTGEQEDGRRLTRGGRMRILAAIHPPEAIRKILDCLSLPPRAPPIAEAAPDHADEFEFF